MSCRKAKRTWTGWGLSMLLCIAAPALGQTVQVSVPQTLYQFTTDGEITVDIDMSGMDLVAGVDLIVSYPVERFQGVPTWENGDLFGLIIANVESTPGQVLVAAADAEGLGVSGGTLVTLTFAVPCDGNDVEGGVDLTLSFPQLFAWDESSQLVASNAPDAVVTLECQPVAVDATRFSTLKGLFDSGDGR